jgi:[ribosomal protein S18]-alanine N-acetyltransferase
MSLPRPAVSCEPAYEPMTEHDLLEVVEIEERSGLSRWGWSAYFAELERGNRNLMLVARVLSAEAPEQELAGYIVARLAAAELHINNVAVRQEFRRRHIGNGLLERVLVEGRRLGANAALLEVRAGNRAAQALYEKCGFRAIGRRRNYYSEPEEDALVMCCSLESPA